PPGTGGSTSGAMRYRRDGSFDRTTSRGAPSYGTIFRIDAAGTLTTLHFLNGADGAAPSGRLTQGSNGSLYGTTSQAGAVAPGYGTVFKVDVAGTLTTLHSFNGGDGAQPRGGLVQADGARFWG